ncbi:PAS domain-containing protein [Endothiovibrio diazotrophicus]
MKSDITPTAREVTLSDEEVIISKTDLKGRITYANRAFMRVSGYSEPRLHGVQHNIVRHPDMPRGAFRLLWKTLQGGNEFFAFVKNLTADGSYYWVFANVTLDHDLKGNVLGYFSVRRKPSPQGIRTISELYREMLELERRAGPANAPDASMAWLLDQVRAHGVGYDEFIIGLQAP